MENNNQVNQLKYTQQHLANERTYLAWIRTAVAIIGIGFLTTSIHFSVGYSHTLMEDILAVILGLSSVGFGIAVILIATVGYFRKKRQIENQVFYSNYFSILFVSLLLIIVATIAVVYFLFSSIY